MKTYFYLFNLIGLFSSVVFAADEIQVIPVDFSKAYISKDSPSTELRINGIGTLGEDDTLQVRSVQLGFNNTSFKLLEETVQEPSAELLEQLLLGTTWEGNYTTLKNVYWTKLNIEIIQDGFIAGEMKHSSEDHPDDPSYLLRVKVVGEITTQYLIDKEGNGEFVWVDADQVDFEELSPEVVIPPDEADRTRQLLRLQRMKALEFKHPKSHWGSSLHEYRMVLSNNKLSGSVGRKSEKYDSRDVITEVGSIELVPPEIEEEEIIE